MHITLVSPMGPLYRHRGGIFRRSLRYTPLTLTTLAALVPDELRARLTARAFVNRADAFMFRNFFPINTMLRVDTNRRDGFPLGDDAWTGSLLRVH